MPKTLCHHHYHHHVCYFTWRYALANLEQLSRYGKIIKKNQNSVPLFCTKAIVSLKVKTNKQNSIKVFKKRSPLLGLNNISLSTSVPTLSIDYNKHRRKKINRLPGERPCLVCCNTIWSPKVIDFLKESISMALIDILLSCSQPQKSSHF